MNFLMCPSTDLIFTVFNLLSIDRGYFSLRNLIAHLIQNEEHVVHNKASFQWASSKVLQSRLVVSFVGTIIYNWASKSTSSISYLNLLSFVFGGILDWYQLKCTIPLAKLACYMLTYSEHWYCKYLVEFTSQPNYTKYL
jgi:hypothetical protein